ncbi:ribonuclease H-like domain-containing protein [Phellopilus nigrolimitatus]|nr:ribonuclease H-like domain-containing protein [Phellopilus nigrolimitatus]
MSQSADDLFLALGTICCGVGPGGSTSMVARVSLVNYRGSIVLDAYVRPTMPVTDYRTPTTGIEAKHLNSESAMHFNAVQSLIAEYIKGKILVGHSLWQDLSVLGVPHPAVATRDVALYMPFRNALQSPNQVVGLQTLVWHLMRRRIQYGKLDSVENARAALDLYRSDSNTWEAAVSSGKWSCALPPSTLLKMLLLIYTP